MLLSPLDLDASPIQRNKTTKNGSRNSQTMSPKSVSFLIETPLQVKSKHPKANFTQNLGDNMRKHKLNIFASRSRCKVMFQALDNRGRPKLNSNKQSPQEDQLNITDSFQYRIESLLEEGDYVLDISSLKKPRQTPAPIGLMIPLHRKKLIETKLEKTNLKARRKSDISLWSGGVSELENKTVFWTFEYISKPITVIDTSYVPKFNKDTERFSAYYKSPGLGIPDGTPTRVSALGRLDGTPTRFSGLGRHDSTPVSVGKKYLNSSMKAWSAKLLDIKKEGNDDKNSPFLRPFKTPTAKGHSLNQSEDVDSDDSSEKSDIKFDKISNPSAILSPHFNDDPKTPSNFEVVQQLQNTLSGAVSKDSATLKHPSSHILSTHLLKSDSEKHTTMHKPMPIMIQQSKSQERFRPFKAGPSPLPVYLKDHSSVKPQRPNSKMTPGSVIIPRHRKNLSLGGSEGDNSASFKMSVMISRNDSVLNSNDNSPARGSSKDTKKMKDFKKILEQHKSNRTKVLLKLQKKLVAKVYSPENSVIIPNPKMLNIPTPEVKKPKANKSQVPKEKKSFFIDSISPNETAILPKVPTSRRGHSHSMSWTGIKPAIPLSTTNSKGSILESSSKLKFSGLHGHSASITSNIDSTKVGKAEKAEKAEKERTKSLKASPKFKPKISQPKQLRISYAPSNHL